MSRSIFWHSCGRCGFLGDLSFEQDNSSWQLHGIMPSWSHSGPSLAQVAKALTATSSLGNQGHRKYALAYTHHDSSQRRVSLAVRRPHSASMLHRKSSMAVSWTRLCVETGLLLKTLVPYDERGIFRLDWVIGLSAMSILCSRSGFLTRVTEPFTSRLIGAQRQDLSHLLSQIEGLLSRQARLRRAGLPWPMAHGSRLIADVGT